MRVLGSAESRRCFLHSICCQWRLCAQQLLIHPPSWHCKSSAKAFSARVWWCYMNSSHLYHGALCGQFWGSQFIAYVEQTTAACGYLSEVAIQYISTLMSAEANVQLYEALPVLLDNFDLLLHSLLESLERLALLMRVRQEALLYISALSRFIAQDCRQR